MTNVNNHLQTRSTPLLEDNLAKAGRVLGSLAKIAIVVSALATAILFAPGSASVFSLYGLKAIALSSLSVNILFNSAALYFYSKSISNAQQNEVKNKAEIDKARQEAADIKLLLETARQEASDTKNALEKANEKLKKAFSQKIEQSRKQKPTPSETPQSAKPIPMLRVQAQQDQQDHTRKSAPMVRSLTEPTASQPSLEPHHPSSTIAQKRGQLIRRRTQTFSEQLAKDATPPPPTETIEVHKNAFSEDTLFATFKTEKTALTEQQWQALSTAFDKSIDGLPQEDLHKGVCELLARCTGYVFDDSIPTEDAKQLLSSLINEIFSRTSLFSKSKEKIIIGIANHMDVEMTLKVMNGCANSYIQNNKVPNDNDDSLKLLIQRFHSLYMNNPDVESKDQIKPFLLGIVLQIGVLGSAVNLTWLSNVMKNLYEKKILTQEHFQFCLDQVYILFPTRILTLRQKLPYIQIALASIRPEYDFSYEPTEEMLDKLTKDSVQ